MDWWFGVSTNLANSAFKKRTVCTPCKKAKNHDPDRMWFLLL